jgi:hypothetical protein
MSKKWLNELQQKIANCREWHSFALQIGFRYAKPDLADDFWEARAYPAVQEIVGGKEDGETVWPGFNPVVATKCMKRGLPDWRSERLV